MNNFHNPLIPDQKNDNSWSEEDWKRAKFFAKKEMRSAYVKNTVNLALFGWILPWLWRIGGVAPLLLLSGDDEEKQKQWAEATRQSMFAPVEGLAYGDVIADGLNMLTGANEKSIYMLGRSNPVFSDIMQAAKKADKDMMAAANDVINIIGGMVFGVNPQTVTDWTAAIIDYNSDAQTQKECALLVARLLSCPPSQLEKVYFEELDMDALEASKLTPDQLAKRYARYKMLREAPLTGWLRNEDERNKVMAKHRKSANTTMNERLNSSLETERTRSLLQNYEEVSKKVKEYKKLKKSDWAAYVEAKQETFPDNASWEIYLALKKYDHEIGKMTKDWLKAKSADSANTIAKDMIGARERMLHVVDSLEKTPAESAVIQ